MAEVRLPRGALAACAALLLGGCLGFDPLSDAERERLKVFDFYWQALADGYPLFGRHGVHWDEIRDQYRAAAPYAERPIDFYHLLAGMLSELDDLHVSLSVPDEKLTEDGEAPTSLLDAEGFRLMPIEGRAHVVSWPEGAEPTPPPRLDPTARYPELVRVEGFPVVLSLVHNLLKGPPGSEAELHLGWRDGSVSRHTLRRPLAGTRSGATSLGPYHSNMLWQRRKADPYRWLELGTLGVDLPVGTIDEQIDDSAAGLILDLRRNLGGNFGVTGMVAGRFLARPVGRVWVMPEESTFAGLVTVEVFSKTEWAPREPVYRGPLVLLTSALTGSAAEHLAQTLQSHAGAVVIGERSAGAEAGVVAAEGPDGAKVEFSGLRILDLTGRGLQDEGVVPDVVVRLTVDDVERLGPVAAYADWEERLLAAARSALASQAAGAPGSGSR